MISAGTYRTLSSDNNGDKLTYLFDIFLEQFMLSV